MVKSEHLEMMRKYTRLLAKALDVRGLMNIQFAIKDDIVYVLRSIREPRAQFRSFQRPRRATGKDCREGDDRKKLSEFNLPDELSVRNFFIKEPVFPFVKFPGVDPLLGPECVRRGSHGNGGEFWWSLCQGLRWVRGRACHLVERRSSASTTATNTMRFASRGDSRARLQDRRNRGTATYLSDAGVPCERVYKVNEGRPNVVDLIKSDAIDLIVNTPLGRSSFYDEKSIRRAAMNYNVVSFTTLTGGERSRSRDQPLSERGNEGHEPAGTHAI
jgi:carbamoyl-phosphate synthase large subunit